MFIIGIILIFRGVYNRPPQKSEACAMARPIVKIAVGQADSSGMYFKVREIKKCCHFLITKCKIFKLLVKLLFLRLFEPDQSEIKEIFYEIVNLHNLGDF